MLDHLRRAARAARAVLALAAVTLARWSRATIEATSRTRHWAQLHTRPLVGAALTLLAVNAWMWLASRPVVRVAVGAWMWLGGFTH